MRVMLKLSSQYDYMENVNEYTKLMGEWLESTVDPELISCVEETYIILKASRAIASSVFPKNKSKDKDVEHDLILDTYQLIVDTKLRNNVEVLEDVFIHRDILENVIIKDESPEEET